MTDSRLVEAVKAGEHSTARALVESGADVNEQDEQGWTPLNFAAGRGDLPMVQLLIDCGANPFGVGRDNRTPYMIALAAGHVEVAKLLRSVEDRTDLEKANSFRSERKYCKAYHLGQLRQFPHWSERSSVSDRNKTIDERETDAALTDDRVVFIHQDFIVTKSIWHDENVVFDDISDSWREFCGKVLGFRVPTDIDLIAPTATGNQR